MHITDNVESFIKRDTLKLNPQASDLRVWISFLVHVPSKPLVFLI